MEKKTAAIYLLMVVFLLVSCDARNEVYDQTFYAYEDLLAGQTLIISGAFRDRELLAENAKTLFFPEEINEMTRLDFMENSDLVFGLIWDPYTHMYYIGEPAVYDLKGNALHTCQIVGNADEFQPLEVDNKQILILYATYEKIVQYDMKNCVQIDTLLEFTPPNKSLYGFSFEPKTNRLAYSLRTYSKSPNPVIIIRNLDSGEEEIIGEGFRPTWSHDGEKLADVSIEGLTIWDGHKKEIVAKVYDTGYPFVPIPKWSADDKFIVFNDWEDDTGVVKRYSLETKSLDTLTQGSFYPVYLPNSIKEFVEDNYTRN